MKHWTTGEPIILVRKQFKQLLHHSNNEEPLRNQLIIDLPTQMGLRTKEIRMAHWEDADIDTGRLTIQNSKSHHLYPIPIPYEIAEKLATYCKHESIREKKGFILRRLLGCGYSHLKKGVPLRNETIWKTWHSVAQRAGIRHAELYTPRLGRHYFAAMWIKAHGNIEALRRILRHKSLAYTQIYLSRLVFFEDVQAEYNRIHNIPQIKGENRKLYSPEYEQVQLCEECLTCPAMRVCKYKEKFSQDEAASGCRFRLLIEERAKT